jgi:hypothetical protein
MNRRLEPREEYMSGSEIIVDGTIKADGTLELDQKLNLSPGRVQVVLRPAQQSEAAREDWWTYMQNARKKMEEAKCRFMEEKEMQAHIEWLREGDRIDELLRQADEPRQKLER